MIMQFKNIDSMFWRVINPCRGSWRPFVATFKWDPSVADFMETVSANRSQRRLDTYLIPGELARSRGSIRFGHRKEGKGYHNRRGDFCLVGGSFEKGNLVVFYRSLELIGGLHYDLVVFREIERQLGIIRNVTLLASIARIYALKGNSNEKLLQHLRSFYEGRH
jgi:hypothetical protein